MTSQPERSNDTKSCPTLDLAGLTSLVENNSIERAYEIFDYDYEQEFAGLSDSAVRERFLKLFEWLVDPTKTSILRIFNQINTSFAERWAMTHLDVDPHEYLMTCNRLILYRQGKSSGLRTRNIAFGVRKNIDFFDPRRQFKLLRGTAPQLLPKAIGTWCRVVNEQPHEPDSILLLTMALIAIHPFPDGNGRLARITYTWLSKRYHLDECWLAEDCEGEFLRQGNGINSTEYLMAAVMLLLGGEHNTVRYGFRETHTEDDDKQALISLESNLLNGRPALLASEEFRSLRNQLEGGGHFRSTTPRFESLTSLIK